jgi:hypothetical protein
MVLKAGAAIGETVPTGMMGRTDLQPEETRNPHQDQSAEPPDIADELSVHEHVTDTDRRPPRKLVPDFYAGSVTNDELNRPRRSAEEFSTEQLADISSVEDYYARRRAVLKRSEPDSSDGDVRYGSANRTQFGDEFATDWRELLPDDHPQRLIGPPLVVAGTPEADATLVAAHDALRAAMRSVSKPPVD